jgi:hypothetical protein
LDITVAELAIESFFPADAATRSILRDQPQGNLDEASQDPRAQGV